MFILGIVIRFYLLFCPWADFCGRNRDGERPHTAEAFSGVGALDLKLDEL